MARYAQAFGMKTIYWDVHRFTELEADYSIEYVEWDDLWQQSDILSVQIPIKPETTEKQVEVKNVTQQEPEAETTWMEEIEVAGGQLVERVKELVAEGNVRRLILRTHDDKLIMEIPLTAGAVVGGVVTLFAPLLAALGALAALVARVKVQIVRTKDDTE